MMGLPTAPFNPPAPMFTIGWGEDIDLNAAPGALATLLSQQPDYRDGSDDLIPTTDIFIKRLWYMDETVGAPGDALLQADRTVGKIPSKTIWRQQMGTSAEFPIQVHEFPGNGFLIPQGTKLSATGASAGSAGEQHVMLLDCWSPGFRPPMTLGNPNAPGTPVAHGLKTGTLVAATISGKNDILGHTAAYEDSELSFGVDPSARYTLYGVIPRPGLAGIGVFGFLHPSGLYHVLRPSIIVANSPIFYLLDQPWAFNGAEKQAPRLVGAGGVTTSTEFQPLFIAH